MNAQNPQFGSATLHHIVILSADEILVMIALRFLRQWNQEVILVLWESMPPMALKKFKLLHLANTTIDYRCDDGRFQMPASCVKITNHVMLSSSEIGVNSEIKP
jgi:hypothetical protein